MIRVALAEDFELLREDMIESITQYEDIEVIGAFSTGKEIVAFVEDGNIPDVILMDIAMETNDAGVLAAGQIHEMNKEINIIYLTAYENDALILQSMEKGAVDYIIKDVSIEVIIGKIRDAYNNKIVLDPKINTRLMKEYSRLRTSERSLLFFIHNVGDLTKTEKILVRYLLDGMTNREIANLRHVELVTIKTQIKNLLKKFGCSRKKEMVAMIHSLGIDKLFIFEKEN